MPKSVQYRVEFRSGSHVESLGTLAFCRAHHSALVPFASWLAREGRSGTLSLIDARTGKLVAQRSVLQKAAAWTPVRKRGVSPLLHGVGTGK